MTQTGIGRGVKITYYGHSAFKLSGAGVNVLIDPWLANPLLNTPLDRVGQVDLILVTHGHGDHVGETVPWPRKTGATVVAIHELSQILAEQGVAKVVGMNKGGTLAPGPQDHHDPGGPFLHHGRRRQNGPRRGSRRLCGAVSQRLQAYHAGDTAAFKDMELIKELYQPELAMLPIGSHYVMNPGRRPWPAGSSGPNG